MTSRWRHFTTVAWPNDVTMTSRWYWCVSQDPTTKDFPISDLHRHSNLTDYRFYGEFQENIGKCLGVMAFLGLETGRYMGVAGHLAPLLRSRNKDSNVAPFRYVSWSSPPTHPVPKEDNERSVCSHSLFFFPTHFRSIIAILFIISSVFRCSSSILRLLYLSCQ